METDQDILREIDTAFGEVEKPEHFTDHHHCEECAEHDALLRSRTRETLQLADVGNPGWNPLNFSSAQGIAYLMPALARLALAPCSYGYDWYGDQLLFALSSGFSDNAVFLYSNRIQRKAVARLLGHLIESRSVLIDNTRSADEFLRAHTLWAESGE